MSTDAVRDAAERALFRPNNRPWLLSAHHVPFDELVRSNKGFEELAARRLVEDGATHVVAVIGASGAGKSSFVAWVTDRLPETHVAIRLPVSALGDPGDTGEALKLSLSTVLEVTALDAAAREEIHIERAEQRTSTRAPTGITAGKIGGGPIPAEVDVEVGSLRQEFVESKLDGDYLTSFTTRPTVIFERVWPPPTMLLMKPSAIRRQASRQRTFGWG
jgi:hypothetical protein